MVCAEGNKKMLKAGQAASAGVRRVFPLKSVGGRLFPKKAKKRGPG